MWWSEPRRPRGAAPLVLALGLAACGFTPLYDPGSAARASRGVVDIAVVPGASGFAFREQLQNRLGVATDPAYRLEADLDLVTSGVALTTGNVTTRFEVIGTADFVLVPLDGSAPVLGDTVEAVASYSAPESDIVSAFGTLSAQRNAELRVARTLADRIATRVLLEADRLAPAPAAETQTAAAGAP